MEVSRWWQDGKEIGEATLKNTAKYSSPISAFLFLGIYLTDSQQCTKIYKEILTAAIMYNILKLGTMQKSISKLNKLQYSNIMSYY